MNKILESNVPLGSNNYFLSSCGVVAVLASATDLEPCTTICPFITFDERRNDSSVGDQLLDEHHLSNLMKKLIQMKHEIHGNCYLNFAGSQLATARELHQLRPRILYVCNWTPRFLIIT
jgi:hypothetical protein